MNILACNLRYYRVGLSLFDEFKFFFYEMVIPSRYYQCALGNPSFQFHFELILISFNLPYRELRSYDFVELLLFLNDEHKS